MNIRFNSKFVNVMPPMSLLAFLQSQIDNCEVVLARSVVAVNQQLVPNHNFGQYELQDKDDVELLTAVVGG